MHRLALFHICCCEPSHRPWLRVGPFARMVQVECVYNGVALSRLQVLGVVQTKVYVQKDVFKY